MVESVGNQDALYGRALELYQQGAWGQVIDLLIEVEEKSDDMRSLLAAARWQVALARAKQRAQTQAQAAPDQRARGWSRLRSRVMPAVLVTANLLIYGVLVFGILVAWQGRSLTAFSALATTPPRESPLLGQAEAAVAVQDWDNAISTLKALLKSQPDNVEARTQLALATEQRRLESLFAQAEGYYNRRLWDQAIASFQNLRASAPDFRSDEVATRLCQTYVQAIRTQIVEAQSSMEKLLPLRAKLTDYAAECNDSDDFSVEQKLLDLYIAGIEAAQLGNWKGAIDFFTQVRADKPDYAGGQTTKLLYAARIRRGEYLTTQGEWDRALEEYNKALALGVPDVANATRLRMAVVQTLAAPSPTPTLVQTSTSTPTATPIPATPTPTATPITPTPTSTPTPSASPERLPTPTTPIYSIPPYRPLPSAAPSLTPVPTQPPAPPKPAPHRPTATPVPPTNTPVPTSTPPPTSTPQPSFTPTPEEGERPPTPTSLPTEESRPPTPTPA
ncbi:MAG: tetratricopeptide repeat protein [Anaerolineae bacterium]